MLTMAAEAPLVGDLWIPKEKTSSWVRVTEVTEDEVKFLRFDPRQRTKSNPNPDPVTYLVRNRKLTFLTRFELYIRPAPAEMESPNGSAPLPH